MALSLDCVPAANPLQASFSPLASEGNGIVAKFIPRNSTGAVYDCTSLTGIALYIRNSQSPAGDGPSGLTPTLGTHDNTGVIATITATMIQNLYQSTMFGITNFVYTLTGTDGANTVILAQGSLALNIGA